MTTLEQQVVLTVAYTDQFEYPLTKNELITRYIVSSKSPSRTPTPKEIESALLALVEQGHIQTEGKYYFLPGRRKIVSIRGERAKVSQHKHTLVRELIGFVRHIPWVKGVAITGSLAVDNATRASDIDFFIVTQTHRLWLVRGLLVLISVVRGKRRTTHQEIPNSWCFNLWVDEDQLAMEKHAQNLYTAYEVCQAKWVFDRDDVQQQFYAHNLWVKKYLPHYWDRVYVKTNTRRPSPRPQVVFRLLEWVSNTVLTGFNVVLYLLQRLYMLPHMTRERVRLGAAFFHPRDTKQLVYTRWQHALRQGD